MYVGHYCHGYAPHLDQLRVLLQPSIGLGLRGASRASRGPRVARVANWHFNLK